MKKKQDELLKRILRNKPKGGEDFWVFSAATTDPEHPTWDERTTFVGGYKQNAECFVALAHVLAEAGLLKSGLRLEMYQGDGARSFLSNTAREEARYQQE